MKVIAEFIPYFILNTEGFQSIMQTRSIRKGFLGRFQNDKITMLSYIHKGRIDYLPRHQPNTANQERQTHHLNSCNCFFKIYYRNSANNK